MEYRHAWIPHSKSLQLQYTVSFVNRFDVNGKTDESSCTFTFDVNAVEAEESFQRVRPKLALGAWARLPKEVG